MKKARPKPKHRRAPVKAKPRPRHNEPHPRPRQGARHHGSARARAKARARPHPKHAPQRTSRPGYTQKIEAITSEITSLKIQGAKDIAMAGIRCMRTVVAESRATKTDEFMDDLRKVAVHVIAARPTEPALRNCIGTILLKLDRYELRRIQNIRKYAATLCERLARDIEGMVARMAAIGAGSITDGDVILTHCHSSHVAAILKEARARKRNFSVIVTETGPLRQGLMTARELLEAGIAVSYCVDSAIGAVMKRTTKVLVGCDAILADGSVVNKIGTLPLAIVAAKFNVPFFVAGESIKFDGNTVLGIPEPIEQRNPDEIAGAAELKARGAEILNPAFDTVPAELITALITELGVMKPELLRQELGF